MRHRYALLIHRAWRGAIALLLLSGAGAAMAAPPVFDGIDWLLDRGNSLFTANTSGVPLREGFNNFNSLNVLPLGTYTAPADGTINNDPGHAVRRWVWPFTRDIALLGSSTNLIVDNPDPQDPSQLDT